MSFLEKFISETLGLTKFPPFLSTFYWAFVGFLFIHQVLAPYFSERIFPAVYGGKSRGAKNNWYVPLHLGTLSLKSPYTYTVILPRNRSIHVVSQVHVLIVVPYALWCILNETPEHGQDRAFGWNEHVGYVHAIACGSVGSKFHITSFSDFGQI